MIPDIHLEGHALDRRVARLRAAGIQFNAYAEQLFARGFPVGVASRTVRVEVHTAAELGLPEGGTLDEAIAHAAPRGLAPCALEVALALRHHVVNASPRITVVSPRASSLDHEPRGFYLRDDADGSWLRGYVASDDWRFEPTERLAFVVRDCS